MGKLASGNIGIDGLYEWGKGWSSKTSALWSDFWLEQEFTKNLDIVVTHTDNFWGKQFYLVGCGVSVYLHPMATSFTFTTSNSAENEKFEMDIEKVAWHLNKMKEFFAGKGYEISWAINWNVLKAEYEGINNMKYVPDFDGERFGISDKTYEDKEQKYITEKD